MSSLDGLSATTQNEPHKKRQRLLAVNSRLIANETDEVATEEFRSWIRASASTKMTYSTEEGKKMILSNIKKVNLADIRESDVGIAAMDNPDEGEEINGDFLSSSNVMFFEFMGSPGEEVDVKCLGTMDRATPRLDFVNKRLSLEAPTHFLVATGDCLVIADQLRHATNGQSSSEPSQKHTTTTMIHTQGAMAERSEPNEKGAYFIYTRDKHRLSVRDKSNIQVRCENLEFTWRAADKGMWRHIAGEGIKLQAKEYWAILLEEAENLHHKQGSDFERVCKIPLIGEAGIAKDIKLLEHFLRGEFGIGGLKLETFCIGAKFAQGEFPCVLRNSPLVNALETLAVSMEILFSVHFAGVCDDLIEVLRGHERPLRLTNSGFLIHSVERTLKKFFRIVSKEDRAIDFPGSDVTQPQGCALLLRRMLAELVVELAP